MSEQLVYVGVFLIVFASIPIILKRFLRGRTLGETSTVIPTKVMSMVGIGSNQSVVTVEVGPDNKRLLLVLGVGAQSIVCLHKFETGSCIDPANLDARISVVPHKVGL